MLDKAVPSTITKSVILKLLIISVAIGSVVAIAKIIPDTNDSEFLLFYGAVVTVTVLVSSWLVQDPTQNQPLPLIPLEPDPYKIAYLRSQEIGVAKVAVMDLSQRGYLQITEELIQQAENHPDVSLLTTIQREIFDWFATPTTPRTSGWLLARQLQPHCTIYQQQLLNEQLLTSDSLKTRTELISWIGASIIVGLGGFKLVVTSLHSRNNMGYLVLMGIFSFYFLQNACQITQHRSLLGVEYLKQLEATFKQLKQKIQADIPEATFAQLKQKVEIGIPSELEYKLAVALYGFELLAGSRYDRFQNIFVPVINTAYKQNSSSGGCGGGGCSGGCSGSCGGGCGGCGGCGGD
ncbi:TIGR04222 domain-containing membrane protein [Nostoc sp. FACHB-87]|uniref:TIGR04222 domain-containing membrane protein n=1 Tax=Nostocaceae TaxID=1162 RepID=UPI001683AF70|nr:MULTISPECIES: TIGR04222 domain-containing membrane protein [Nostocaceae]MBD2454436.1 TIGR04222 domain-containing membrane protein [Nostoc sp. FACHB-87]MBD2474378.1 TIGR04222 domain-containing membrane protein [Anabaena sp. FACHB-83]